MNVFTYDENSFTEGKYKKVDDIPSVPLPPITPMLCMYLKFFSRAYEKIFSVPGIDVDGVHQHDIIAQIGARYEIHALVQTDITTTEQRTKLDVFDDALFLVCKLIFRDIGRTGHTVIEQISFYIKDNILITFQETPKDLFDSIKSTYRQV